MNKYENDYKALLERVLHYGESQEVRDNNSAVAMFGETLSFDCKYDFFPMLTSKEMYFKNIKHELYWLLAGNSNINYLKNNGVSIWNLWADDNGDIGDTYGRQLRGFNGIDQLTRMINDLRTEPQGRQHVISLWNPLAIREGNIKPCYHSFQVVVINRVMNIVVSQRSADLFVGLPYDMGVFTLLLMLLAKELNYIAGTVKINIGNAHIYKEHIQGVETYLCRPISNLPNIINYATKVIGFETEKVTIRNYKPLSFIKAKIII